MAKNTYDLQGYVLSLRHIMMITPVFTAQEEEGFQFNVRMTDMRLPFKYPTRQDATLSRELLIKAINDMDDMDAIPNSPATD